MKKETPPYLAKPSKSTFTTVCRLHLLRTQQNHLVFGFNLYLLVPKSITTPHNINTNTHQHRNTKNTFIYTEVKIIKRILALKLFVLLIFLQSKSPLRNSLICSRCFTSVLSSCSEDFCIRSISLRALFSLRYFCSVRQFLLRR